MREGPGEPGLRRLWSGKDEERLVQALREAGGAEGKGQVYQWLQGLWVKMLDGLDKHQ